VTSVETARLFRAITVAAGRYWLQAQFTGFPEVSYQAREPLAPMAVPVSEAPFDTVVQGSRVPTSNKLPFEITR